MKTLAFLSVLFFSGASNAASVSLPAFIVGTWSQASRSAEKDIYKVGADLSFVQEMTRQVGATGTSIPYPTVCRYRQTGMIDSFGQPSTSTLDIFRNAVKEKPAKSLGYKVTRLELLASSSNTSLCTNFIQNQNTKAATSAGLHYTWSFSDFSDNVIFDPWYITVYTKN